MGHTVSTSLVTTLRADCTGVLNGLGAFSAQHLHIKGLIKKKEKKKEVTNYSVKNLP